MSLDPLAQIHLITIAAVIGIALATMLLLRPIFFLPLLEVMARRAARIDAAQVQQAEAEALLQGARRDLEVALAAAKTEAAQRTAQLMESATAIRSDLLAKASAEAEALLVTGRAEILGLKQAEEARLSEELSACVGQALTAMIGPVDGAALRFVVKRVLATTTSG